MPGFSKIISDIESLARNEEFAKEVIAKILAIGETYRNFIAIAKEARENNTEENKTFNQIDYSKIAIGEPVALFKYKKRGEKERQEFFVTKQEDGSPLTTADLYGHKKLTDFFREKLPSATFISEEGNIDENRSAIIRNKRLADTGKALPLVAVDGLDNTLGYLNILLGKENTPDFHTSHAQFSINVGISDPKGRRGLGFVYLPYGPRREGYNSDTLIYSNAGGAFISHPQAKIEFGSVNPILDDHFPNQPDVLTSNHDYDHFRKTGTLRIGDFLKERKIELYHPTPAAGMARLAKLLETPSTGGFQLSRTGTDTWLWDVSAGFEICRAAGLGIGVRPGNEEKFEAGLKELARFPEHFYGTPGVLNELGLKVVISPTVNNTVNLEQKKKTGSIFIR